MKAAWTRVSLLLAAALLAFGTAVWMVRAARAQARLPFVVAAAERTFNKFGGAEGLAQRRQTLVEARQRLERERAAMSSDAALFNRRVGEVFTELGLQIATSSGWQALPDFTAERAAGFARTFTGSGDFTALLDAILTFESWSDHVRVRSVSVVADGPGSVQFSLQIAVVRIKAEAT